MKDIKKLLKEQSDAILPDKSVKENIRRELGLEEAPAREAAYAHGGTASLAKKRTIGLIAAALALALILALALPLALRRSPSTPSPGGGIFDQISDDTSFYAYGAASVGAILSGGKQSGSSTSLRQMKQSSRPEQIEKVTRYLSLVEGLLSDSFDHEESQNTAGYEEYSFRMTVKVKDLLGNYLSYTMYYDKFPISSETDDDETEEKYSIRGILLVDGVEYPVEGSGETETETEPDETEEETKMTFYVYDPTDADGDSYIRMEQEMSTETEEGETEVEQKYIYTTFLDGRETERTTVEYERDEDGELELKLVVEGEDVKDELVFKDERGTGTALRVEGKLDGEDTSFYIYIKKDENGNTYYDFVFGQNHYQHDRFDDDDDDDDDNDHDDDDDDDD